MRVMSLESDNRQESVFGIAGQLFDCCPWRLPRDGVLRRLRCVGRVGEVVALPLCDCVVSRVAFTQLWCASTIS